MKLGLPEIPAKHIVLDIYNRKAIIITARWDIDPKELYERAKAVFPKIENRGSEYLSMFGTIDVLEE